MDVKQEELKKWQEYARNNLSRSNTIAEEYYQLTSLELEIPYKDLGFHTLGHFLLNVPSIGDVLIDQSNIFRKPSIVPVGYSPMIQFGERVTWLHPDGRYVKGTVNFIGSVEGILSAGIVFDEKVGPDHNILWFGTVIFTVAPGYGKILPVNDLIQENQTKAVAGSSKKNPPILENLTKFAQSALKKIKPEDYNTKGIQSFDVGAQSVKFNKEGSNNRRDDVGVYPRSVESNYSDGLNVNDVVVWVTDSGSYNGIVMWLGRMRSGGRIYAGVDFQQDIGDTDGTYEDHDLFRCRPKQGKFIPISFLIKYDDFYQTPALAQSESKVETKKEIKTEEVLVVIDEETGRTERTRWILDDSDLLGIQDLTIAPPIVKPEIRMLETEIQEFQIGDRIKYKCPILEGKGSRPLIGTIKWLGNISGKELAGIDFDEKTGLSQNNEEVFPFEFKSGHGGLAPLSSLEHCGPNEGIIVATTTPSHEYRVPFNPDLNNPAFLNTFIEPCISVGSFGRSVGFHQGIQGKNNSCYIDTTLFVILAYTDAFDEVLLKDDPYAGNSVRSLKAILRTDVANQLRRNYFCSAQNINILRRALSGLSSRIKNSEMADIEEFLYILFGQGLQLPKFIHYSSGVSEFVHQILPNRNAPANYVVTTQKILENSMFAQNNLKFECPPSPGLFMALPRSNGEIVQYKAVIPSLKIDITHLLQHAARPCTICSVQQATLECLGCFDMIGNTGMGATAFCDSCFQTFHTAESRQPHKASVKPISCASKNTNSDEVQFPRFELDLIGVICIKESHYVSFVKCGTDLLAPWVMHNSMADAGIPEIRDVPGLGECLIELEKNPAAVSRDWSLFLPEVQRILQDIYFCVYAGKQTNKLTN